jgi:hypothetical protein
MVPALGDAGTGQRGVNEGADLLGGIVENLGVELAGGAGGVGERGLALPRGDFPEGAVGVGVLADNIAAGAAGGDRCQSLDFKISFWFRAQPVCSNGAFGVSMVLIPVTFRHPAE